MFFSSHTKLKCRNQTHTALNMEGISINYLAFWFWSGEFPKGVPGSALGAKERPGGRGSKKKCISKTHKASPTPPHPCPTVSLTKYGLDLGKHLTNCRETEVRPRRKAVGETVKSSSKEKQTGFGKWRRVRGRSRMEEGQVPWLKACAQAAEMVHELFTDRDVSFYSLLWRPSDVHQSSPPPYILPRSFLVWGHLRGWGRDWEKVAPSISVNVEAEMKKKLQMQNAPVAEPGIRAQGD